MARLMLPVALLGALASPGGLAAQIVSSAHNLSVTGGGSINSAEEQICVFCHTPHGGDVDQTPLWNRSIENPSYQPYDGTSLQASVGQPSADSKLCLSCHDGTIAIGAVLNIGGQGDTISMSGAGPGGTMPSGGTLIGTSLREDHPVSFVYDQTLVTSDGELADPATLTGEVRLKSGLTAAEDNVQCTTCHDPHSTANPKFLRYPPTGQGDNLCLQCHQKTGWTGSTHEAASDFWPSGQSTTRVRDQSCMACHTPHTVSGAERLLREAAISGQSAIEETCFLCHQGAGSGGIAPDIDSEFAKTARHPVTDDPGAHKPVFIPEPPMGLPENVLLNPGSPAPDSRFTDQSHVECVDCHNPHRVVSSNRSEGVRGIGLDGSVVANVINDPAPADGQPSTRQFPVCLRCHGDTFAQVLGTSPLSSGALPSNKRVEFQTANSSFHPVSGPGRNNSGALTSQLSGAGLGVNSVIKCTDCHNSDEYGSQTGRMPTTGTSANSPVGPHGSSWGSILRARYENILPGPSSWNASNFDLCFRCHSENRLMSRRRSEGARTNFYDNNREENLHEVHLDDRSDKARALCKSCHYNIHSNVEAPNTQYNIDGVVYSLPPASFPTRLINFHPNVQPIGGRPKPEWEINTGTRRRWCYLECHSTSGGVGGGETMNGEQYRPAAADDLN